MQLLGVQMNAGIGTRRLRRSGTDIVAESINDEGDGAKRLLAAQARALWAIDLLAELGCRSERLLAMAPKLRARATDL
ncbi:hypothetical protein AB4144_64165, partial [Rhizobiaceae sp. 2RAB30]